MMRALAFAARSLVRQPARATLGILGVAAVGALLFDMLLLSRGLIVSMADLLERTGYDVRVTTTADLPRTSPPLPDATATVDAIAALDEVRTAIGIRFIDVTLATGTADEEVIAATFQGIVGTGRPWTLLRGRDIALAVQPVSPKLRRGGGVDEVVINQQLASALRIEPGATMTINPSCDAEVDVLPPVTLRVIGIVSFPFELSSERTMGGAMPALDAACGGNGVDQAHMLLVTSQGDADATAAAIARLRPDLHAATNAQMIGRIEQGGFTYFRQISTVLTTVTVAFALLLICVLLTVSVNQRLGEIAALRALGFSRRRVVSDVLSESVLIVGIGGLLSLPLGIVLASWLDRILKNMPNIPAELHFFVFEPAALAVHAGLLAVTAVIAALYPMSIVARLPIAATLRNEVIS
jgi:putative ABC transport system permease protein